VLTEICAALSDAPRARSCTTPPSSPRQPGGLGLGRGVRRDIDRYLGMLAATMGDAAVAAEHYEAALARRRDRRRPLAARTRYWFGRCWSAVPTRLSASAAACSGGEQAVCRRAWYGGLGERRRHGDLKAT